MSILEWKLAGLAFFFKLQGGVDFTKDFRVRQAVKGYRKSHKRKDSRRPVSFSNLQAIFEALGSLCSSVYEIALFKAAFSLAFFGVFSELVSPSHRVPGGILVQDVLFSGEQLQVLLARLKTDQAGKGVRVELFTLSGSPVCPVQVVREFMDRRRSFRVRF